MFADEHEASESAWMRRQRTSEQQTAEQVTKGHGRLEQRTLTSTTALNNYLQWPSVQQVFKVERRRTIRGQTSVEVAYGITSLSREQADAKRLLELTRGHWGIENRLFYVRDVTFGEDRCRVRTGAAAQVMATMRNVAITLLNLTGCRNKAAALRRYAARPDEAIALVRGSPEN